MTLNGLISIWGILLINDVCRRAQLTAGGAAPQEIILGVF